MSSLSVPELDRLLEQLSPEILTLSSPGSATAQDAVSALNETEKRRILEKVLRSPQFTQALSSITSAIRDGGLPSVAEALGVSLAQEGGGYVPGTREAVNGGHAVEVFLRGVKRAAEEEERKKQDGSGDGSSGS